MSCGVRWCTLSSSFISSGDPRAERRREFQITGGQESQTLNLLHTRECIYKRPSMSRIALPPLIASILYLLHLSSSHGRVGSRLWRPRALCKVKLPLLVLPGLEFRNHPFIHSASHPRTLHPFTHFMRRHRDPPNRKEKGKQKGGTWRKTLRWDFAYL
jgi:hypothetical protein